MEVSRLLAPDGRTYRIDADGTLKVFTGTDPAANVEVSETVPAGKLWLVQSVWVTLVTDSNAGTRGVDLVLDDGSDEYDRFPAGSSQGASITRQMSWFVGGAALQQTQSGGTGSVGMLPPDLYVPAGHRLRTVTTNRQAGDNFGAPKLLIIEFAPI